MRGSGTAQWRPDPWTAGDAPVTQSLRWWDGSQWTESIRTWDGQKWVDGVSPFPHADEVVEAETPPKRVTSAPIPQGAEIPITSPPSATVGKAVESGTDPPMSLGEPLAISGRPTDSRLTRVTDLTAFASERDLFLHPNKQKELAGYSRPDSPGWYQDPSEPDLVRWWSREWTARTRRRVSPSSVSVQHTDLQPSPPPDSNQPQQPRTGPATTEQDPDLGTPDEPLSLSSCTSCGRPVQDKNWRVCPHCGETLASGRYHPGDIVNGNILGSDNVWHAIPTAPVGAMSKPYVQSNATLGVGAAGTDCDDAVFRLQYIAIPGNHQ